MKIAVKDANVFIDMESMGILDLWFLLGYETLTSSLEGERRRFLPRDVCIEYIRKWKRLDK
jgi:hypothetical protein